MYRALMIDDKRNFDASSIPSHIQESGLYVQVARDYELGLIFLKTQTWNLLLLDNDLGGEKEGRMLLDLMEEGKLYIPDRIIPITSNPVARTRMNVVINRLMKGRS